MKKKDIENIEDMDISRLIHSEDKFTEFEDINGKICCSRRFKIIPNFIFTVHV